MEKLNIIKIGGSVIEEEAKLDEFLKSFAGLNQNKILVHGGGSTATEIGKKLGLESKRIDGRRVTDDQYIDVVTMVYGGLVNKQIVAKLISHGCQALGLTGADGNYLLSQKREKVNGIDFGWVGDPISTRTSFLDTLLKDEIVPVAAPLTNDGNGHILNTNADTIASTIASAMSKIYQVDLIYAFELDGVMADLENPNSLLKDIDNEKYSSLKSNGKIFDGMIPKLDNAFSAISKGVNNVKILKYNAMDKLDNAAFDQYTNIH